jgi:hypothetical protein
VAVAPTGLGVAWIDHCFPFQPSASVIVVPLAFTQKPTAVHAAAEAHDTALSTPLAAPLGKGGRLITHLAPFQTSAIGSVAAEAQDHGLTTLWVQGE